MSQWMRTGVVLDFVMTLANDYETLALEAVNEAERTARIRRFETARIERAIESGSIIDKGMYAEMSRTLTESEQQFRTDARRFQEEADRLRGTNARRVRPSTVSAGLRRV